MRILFLVNPAAGKGRAKRLWEQAAPRLSGLGDFDVLYTGAPGEATRMARDAAERGYDRVAAVGGDGTINEVMNGLAGTDAALAVLPGGTGNDYAHCTGLPVDMYEAGRVALLGDSRLVDVGHLSTGKYFLSVIGAGFDAEVAANVNKVPKYFGGTIPYMAGILKTLWQYAPREMEIEIDGRLLSQKTFLVAVGLAASFGGGMRITPDAVVDDGLFDVCIAGDVGKAEVLRLVPLIYKGTHVTHPKVRMTRCRDIAIRSNTPTAIQAEGELIGNLPIEITLLPRYLRLACPKSALAQAAD